MLIRWGAMKEIRGFIYYPMLGEQKGGTLLADHFTMTRYHCKDTLAFAVRDSLNKIEALKADSLKKISEEEVVDSLHKVAEEHKEDVQTFDAGRNEPSPYRNST